MLLPWAANAKSYSLLGFPQRSRKAFLDSHTGNVETTVFSFWGTRAGQNGRLVNMPTGSIWMDGKHWVQFGKAWLWRETCLGRPRKNQLSCCAVLLKSWETQNELWKKNVTQQKKAMVSEPPKRIQGTRATSQ
jgi:hypothetical protein